MKISLVLFSASVLLSLILIGCPSPGSENTTPTYPAVTTLDIHDAGTGFGKAISDGFQYLSTNLVSITPVISGNTTTYSFTSNDGTVHIVLVYTGSISAPTNMQYGFTFTNLQDPRSGYAISGTVILNYDLTFNPAHMNAGIDLNFSGTGPVKKLTANIVGTIAIISGMPTGSSTITSSTVKCNGQSITPADIGL